MEGSSAKSALGIYKKQKPQESGIQTAKKLKKKKKKSKAKVLLNGVKNEVQVKEDANGAKNCSNEPVKNKKKKGKNHETPQRAVVPQKRKIVLEKEEEVIPSKKKKNNKKKKFKNKDTSKSSNVTSEDDSSAKDAKLVNNQEVLENGSVENDDAETALSNSQSTSEFCVGLDVSFAEGIQEDSEGAAESGNTSDSQKIGQETFEWIIHPMSTKEFFKTHWEKEPLIIKRGDPTYYKGVFSCADLDKILREQVVQFSKNLDITSYSDGKRETHNPIGRAHAPVVWDYYNNGCSVRMLNPQTFHEKVWKMLSSLQEYFLSFCGANVYLTPPDSQGFAPHWDDIEAFILQLEGKKRWRLYRPRSSEEELPRFSSPNLSPNEVGEPFHDVVLEAGDLMYFPRGIIHQGNTVDQEHSLHITLSTYQKTSWADYFERFLQQTLAVAVEEDVDFRKGLPFRYLSYMGVAHADQDSSERKAFFQKVKELMTKLVDYGATDAAADQLGSNFVHDCLPPALSHEEKQCTVFSSGDTWSRKLKRVVNRVELEPDTEIRLVRKNCIRIVADEEVVKVYHTLENSREYHAEEPQYVEMSVEHAPAVEMLLHSYPDYLSIEELPLDNEEDKMTVAVGLWEKGIISSRYPPPVI
ncbi:bifunctional lysine-specific demethylase and histidyl-hydroxylase NO66 [Oratosquilla oratoria]|uniref:bifunctional lysine-specific demethylase and histidyl-hydroxylase NO66 n=1 Tax=Oratosquilla oratoria TaxID=337810 RepID=UPI003F75D538